MNKEFTNLRKAIKTENAKSLKRTFDAIDAATVQDFESYFCGVAYLPPRMKNARANYSLDELKAAARAGATKEYAKALKKAFEHISEVENAPELEQISVSVEWKKSRTWGNCPRATVSVWGYSEMLGHSVREDFGGYASGCGYDKESAAVFEAFNKSPVILKPFYRAMNKPANMKLGSREALGYGLGYGILPQFDGGTGMSVCQKLFESVGYSFKCTGTGKTFDAYTVEKAARKHKLRVA